MQARMLLPGLVLLCWLATAGSAMAATFTVSSTGDGGDASPGNGTCATGGGVFGTGTIVNSTLSGSAAARMAAASPALDAAAAIGLATDQRGAARPIGPAPDIGAVEGTASFLSPSLLASLLSLGPLLQGTLTVDLPRAILPGDLPQAVAFPRCFRNEAPHCVP